MPTRSSYDQVKEYNGKRYTGMRVGRSHTWRYDPGEWKERKVTPDRWEFRYAVVKRRAGRAPEGSGAPLGTSHHWYIVADQVVTKLDANSYTTEMVGHKLKVAHRRAGQTSWNAGERARRKQLVKLLRELADDLESRPIEDDAARNRTPAASSGHRTPAAPAASNGHRPPAASNGHRTSAASNRHRTSAAPAASNGHRTATAGNGHRTPAAPAASKRHRTSAASAARARR